MGLVRKSKSYEKTPTSKPGRTSSLRTVKRYFSKLAAFFFVTIVFGIIYSGTSQPILNMAWRGEIAWSSAISQSIVKALQYGTMMWPEFVINGIDAMRQARPFTAAINNFIPLSVLFIGNFYWVSFWLDLLDGREGEVFRYWVIALLTIVWMVFVYALMNGMFFVAGADVTFDADQIEANIQEYGAADPMGKPHAPINGTQVNASQPAAANMTAVDTDDGGVLDTNERDLMVCLTAVVAHDLVSDRSRYSSCFKFDIDQYRFVGFELGDEAHFDDDPTVDRRLPYRRSRRRPKYPFVPGSRNPIARRIGASGRRSNVQFG